MKLDEISIIKFFQQPKQLIVFNPQRIYRWTERECQQLWDDIIRVAQDTSVSSYFVGTIVYVEYDLSRGSSVPRFILLDGQQRLVTVSLLVAALWKTIDKNKCPIDARYEEINDMFLFNSQEKGELYYKLILAQSDKDTFIRLIKKKELSSSDSSRLISNYRYFENKIYEGGVNIALLCKGISKLTIMDVSTDRRYENPQLVYERINSTGLDATQAGLIRNWLRLLRNAAAV